MNSGEAEDKFPIFFLGVTTVLLVTFVGLPVVTSTLGALYDGFMRLITPSSSFRRKRYGEEDDKANGPLDAAVEFMTAVLDPVLKVLWVCTHPAHVRSWASLMWRHPTLFRTYSLPKVVSYCFRLRVILIVLWLFSFYVFYTATPRAASYEVLGLTPTATQEQVRGAYRKLSFRYHPDKDPSEEAREIYAKIRRAYQRITGDKDDGAQNQEELGVGVALPKFLRDTENEGRTLFFLLLIAFGVPGFLIYYCFLRRSRTYQTCHEDLRKSTALAHKLHRALGMPESPHEKEQKAHIANVTELLQDAGLWQSGMKEEDVLEAIPMPLPQLYKLCDILRPNSLANKRTTTDAKEKLVAIGFEEDEARDVLVSTVTNDTWKARLANYTPAKPSDCAPQALPSSDAEREVLELYLEEVMGTMRDAISPFDVQGKSKKLFKLYEDKLALLRRLVVVVSSTTNNSPTTPNTNVLEKLFLLDQEIAATHADIERGAMEYFSSGHRRSWKRYQRHQQREAQMQSAGRGGGR